MPGPSCHFGGPMLDMQHHQSLHKRSLESKCGDSGVTVYSLVLRWHVAASHRIQSECHEQRRYVHSLLIHALVHAIPFAWLPVHSGEQWRGAGCSMSELMASLSWATVDVACNKSWLHTNEAAMRELAWHAKTSDRTNKYTEPSTVRVQLWLPKKLHAARA